MLESNSSAYIRNFKVYYVLAWAAALDCQVIALEEDAGISGKSIRAREGLQRALELACSQKAALVVYSLSRLSHSTRDILMVQKCSISLGLTW